MYSAYKFAKKAKRYRKDVIKFSLRQEEYILSICKKLALGRYNFGEHKEFYVYEPKIRKILVEPFLLAILTDFKHTKKKIDIMLI